MMSYSYLPWGGLMPREGTGIGPSIRACRVSGPGSRVHLCEKNLSLSCIRGTKWGYAFGPGFHGKRANAEASAYQP